ncbi:MAG TPA: extracellular solute-binding protein, partial [Chloroflexota bacterium]|nr:extracellular solute-binding protein [Chloroflexota bacterium]
CTTAVAAGPAATAVVQPATIKYQHVDTGQQVWQQSWGEIFASFKAKYPQHTLEVSPGPTGTPHIEKAIATFAAGDAFDMLYGHQTFLSPFLKAGILQPLNPYLQKDRDLAVGDFLPAAVQTLKGQTYGIAWFMVGGEIWYNADLLAQAGAPSPKQLEKEGKWTWDALQDVATRVTRRDGDQVAVYGFNSLFNRPDYFSHSLYAWGADWFDTGITRATMDTPAFATATQAMVDLVAKHRVAGGGDFTRGTLAMYLTSTWYIRAVDESPARQAGAKFETTMLPKGPAGRPVPLQNNANYLGKGGRSLDATWLFYKHLLSKDVEPQIVKLGGARYQPRKAAAPALGVSYEDLSVYEASLKLTRTVPQIAMQAELDAEWRDRWAAMTQNQQGVRDALQQLQTRATQLLQQGGCVC